VSLPITAAQKQSSDHETGFLGVTVENPAG
jgi:hypothetical protein